MLFLPVSEENIEPSMPMTLYPSRWKGAKGSPVRGSVAWVSPWTGTYLGMMQLFGNETVVNDLVRRRLVQEVRVRVDGPVPDGSGPYCCGDITLGRSRPVDLLVPFLAR